MDGDVFRLLAFIDAVSPGSIRGFLSLSTWIGIDASCFMCLSIESGFLKPIDCIRQSRVIVTTLGIDELTRSVGEVGKSTDVDGWVDICVLGGIDLCFMWRVESVGVVSSLSRCCSMTAFGTFNGRGW